MLATSGGGLTSYLSSNLDYVLSLNQQVREGHNYALSFLLYLALQGGVKGCSSLLSLLVDSSWGGMALSPPLIFLGSVRRQEWCSRSINPSLIQWATSFFILKQCQQNRISSSTTLVAKINSLPIYFLCYHPFYAKSQLCASPKMY